MRQVLKTTPCCHACQSRCVFDNFPHHTLCSQSCHWSSAIDISRNTPGATTLEEATVAAALKNTPAAVGFQAHVQVTSPCGVDGPSHARHALPATSQRSRLGGGAVGLPNPPSPIEYSTLGPRSPAHSVEYSTAGARNPPRSVEHSKTGTTNPPQSIDNRTFAPKTPPRRVECSTTGRKPALEERKVAGASTAAPAYRAQAQQAGYAQAGRDRTELGGAAYPGKEPYHNRCYNCGRPGHLQTQCKGPRRVKGARRGSKAGQSLLESAGRKPQHVGKDHSLSSYQCYRSCCCHQCHLWQAAAPTAT
jgi:hypothetical protein